MVGIRADLDTIREKAEKEPLGVDISDYSDEFCKGFLAGQVNALDAVRDRLAGCEILTREELTRLVGPLWDATQRPESPLWWCLDHEIKDEFVSAALLDARLGEPPE